MAADAANTIHLQLPPTRFHNVGPVIEEHMCPALLAVPSMDEVRTRWDLTLQRLLRWIDGTRTTAEIASASRTDLSLAVQALQALQASGWVRIVERFSMLNAYACTAKLHAVTNDAEACAQLVCTTACKGASSPASWSDVLRLYTAFRPLDGAGGWRSVHAVTERHPECASRVDVRALVLTGLLNGLLRQVAEKLPGAIGDQPIEAAPSRHVAGLAARPPDTSLLAPPAHEAVTVSAAESVHTQPLPTYE